MRIMLAGKRAVSHGKEESLVLIIWLLMQKMRERKYI